MKPREPSTSLAAGSGAFAVTVRSCRTRSRPTLPPESLAEGTQPVRRPLLVYCGRCEQHHVAFADEREDDTVWTIEHHACQASFAAPVVRAAATDPLVLDGVRARLEQALQPAEPRPRRAPSEHDVEVDAWRTPG